MRKLLALGLLLVPASLVAQETSLLAPSHLVKPARVAPSGGISGVQKPVTFSDQVVRLLQTHCQTCHHDGDIAPFPLVTYQDAYEHRFLIHEMVTTRKMPPWLADASCSRFQHDPSLTEEEIATFERWVLADAPEGDRARMPQPLSFSSAWKLGEPEATVKMAEPFQPDLSESDVYRCFVLPTSFAENRYVTAMEVLPGSRAMVHHVLVFVESGNASLAKDAGEPGPGYTCFGGPIVPVDGGLGGWAPGNVPELLPEGVGISLPMGARLIMQVHYSRQSGVREPDQTSLGLHFAHGPVKKRLISVPLVNTTFNIPAGARDYEVRASIPLIPFAVHLLGITPHMHLLGQSMEVSATLPGGAEVCLIKVPEWDFHWQRTYMYREPVALPAFSGVQLVATYDNSVFNAENPNNPPKNVGWGEQTSDEMCLAFLSFTLDYEDLTR